MNFDELVGGDDLTPEEEVRLRRVHDLLVQAGPPADLPPALETPTAPPEAEIVQFPLLPRRRWAVAALRNRDVSRCGWYWVSSFECLIFTEISDRQAERIHLNQFVRN